LTENGLKLLVRHKILFPSGKALECCSARLVDDLAHPLEMTDFVCEMLLPDTNGLVRKQHPLTSPPLDHLLKVNWSGKSIANKKILSRN